MQFQAAINQTVTSTIKRIIDEELKDWKRRIETLENSIKLIN